MSDNEKLIKPVIGVGGVGWICMILFSMHWNSERRKGQMPKCGAVYTVQEGSEEL